AARGVGVVRPQWRGLFSPRRDRTLGRSRITLFLRFHRDVTVGQRWLRKTQTRFMRRLLMNEPQETPRTRPAPGIQHPQQGQKCKTHFAAFGFAEEGVKQVFGQLRHKKSGKTYAGATLHPPSKDTGYWVIHFVRNDFPHGDNDIYTLEV